MLTFQLPTREDTRTIGRTLGALLKAGDVIGLVGDLGVGKTTLTQAIAEGMGIEERVTSPTFTLVQEYGIEPPMFHFDPYRLDSPEDMCDFGFADYLEQEGVVVVEWADKIQALLPSDHLTLTLLDPATSGEESIPLEGEEIGDVLRYLAIEAGGERARELAAALENDAILKPLQIPADQLPKRPVVTTRSTVTSGNSWRNRVNRETGNPFSDAWTEKEL